MAGRLSRQQATAAPYIPNVIATTMTDIVYASRFKLPFPLPAIYQVLVCHRLTSSPLMTPETSAASPLTAVERSLRDSLFVSDFRDVYLYAFSRRTVLPDRTLKISRPLPVVAISSILKHTDSFSKCEFVS